MPTAPADSPASSPARRPATGAFRCYPGSSLGRVQGLIGPHYAALWERVAAEWLPTAEPISPRDLELHGDYSRESLWEVIASLAQRGELIDGVAVCYDLRTARGWRCDMRLAALIHAWSRALGDKLRRP